MTHASHPPGRPSKALAAFLESIHSSTEEGARAAAAGRRTPLHMAAEVGHAGHVRELIALGADVNAVTMLVGKTPLAEAVDRGHVEVAEILLQAGADPNLGTPVLDEAVLRANLPLVELLERHGGRGTREARLDVRAETLERIRRAMMDEGRGPAGIIDLVDELNRDGVPPIQGDGPWDYVMVLAALDLAAREQAATQSPRLRMGGTLTLMIDGEDVRFELTDAAYGVVYREEESDVFEVYGEAVSVCANVPRGPATEAAAEGEYARLTGATFLVRAYGNAFADPFVVRPGGERDPIVGGTISVEEAKAVPGALEQHDAVGTLAASVELIAKHAGAERRYRGRIEVAFVAA